MRLKTGLARPLQQTILRHRRLKEIGSVAAKTGCTARATGDSRPLSVYHNLNRRWRSGWIPSRSW